MVHALLFDFIHLKFLQEGCLLDLLESISLGLLSIHVNDLAFVVLQHVNLFLVVTRSLAEHVASCLVFRFLLSLELRSLLLHIDGVQTFLVEIDLSLTLLISHLVFQELLDLLVLAELNQLVALCLNAMSSGVVIDHFTPETVLFFLRDNTTEK